MLDSLQNYESQEFNAEDLNLNDVMFEELTEGFFAQPTNPRRSPRSRKSRSSAGRRKSIFGLGDGNGKGMIERKGSGGSGSGASPRRSERLRSRGSMLGSLFGE